MPSSLRGGVWGLSRFLGIWGEKSPEKKSFRMCLGIHWGGINDVSGRFCLILSPVDPNLGPRSPAEPGMRPEVPSSLKAGFGDLAVFGGVGVKNHPPKKVLECVWGYFGRI